MDYDEPKISIKNSLLRVLFFCFLFLFKSFYIIFIFLINKLSGYLHGDFNGFISVILAGLINVIILPFTLKIILNKKSNVRLYTEDTNPELDENNDCWITFWLKNKSKVPAEKVQILCNLGADCFIKKIDNKNIKDVSYPQEAIFQINVDFVYCYPNDRNTKVGRILLHFNKLSEIKINYDIVAKNIRFFYPNEFQIIEPKKSKN